MSVQIAPRQTRASMSELLQSAILELDQNSKYMKLKQEEIDRYKRESDTLTMQTSEILADIRALQAKVPVV